MILSRQLVLLIPPLLFFQMSYAYDSTGGKAIETFLSRVEFQEGLQPEVPPRPLFPWTAERRQEVLNRIEETLGAMPLDTADLLGINKIIISNEEGACPTLIVLKLRELKGSISDPRIGSKPSWLQPGGDLYNYRERRNWYLKNCHFQKAGWEGDNEIEEVLISGSVYFAQRAKEGGDKQSYFAGALFHELSHAWETGHPGQTPDFYGKRFFSLKRTWDWNEKKAETMALRDAKISPDEKFMEFVRHPRYQALNLPSRWAGKTGREVYVPGVDMEVPDHHPMKDPSEYFAALVELLWVDPDLAAEYYSPEEIQWVQARVFKGFHVRMYPSQRIEVTRNEFPARLEGMTSSVGSLGSQMDGKLTPH